MGLPNTGAAGFSADSVPRVVTIAERKHNGIRVLIGRGAARAVTKRGRGGEGGVEGVGDRGMGTEGGETGAIGAEEVLGEEIWEIRGATMED